MIIYLKDSEVKELQKEFNGIASYLERIIEYQIKKQMKEIDDDKRLKIETEFNKIKRIIFELNNV